MAAAHDYEVNLKSELEIMSLHEKIDDIRIHQLEALFARLEAKVDALKARVASAQGLILDVGACQLAAGASRGSSPMGRCSRRRA